MLNGHGHLGISKIRAETNKTGYAYSTYIKATTREEINALRLQEIFGGNVQKTGGKQYIWQLPQKHIILLLQELMDDLRQPLRKQAEIIIEIRRTAITEARTSGRNGILPEIWEQLDQYYDEMKIVRKEGKKSQK